MKPLLPDNIGSSREHSGAVTATGGLPYNKKEGHRLGAQTERWGGAGR
jgi:hypothetical protein